MMNGEGYGVRSCAIIDCGAILAYPDEGMTCDDHANSTKGETMSATDSYNRTTPRWASVVAYTHNGCIYCTTCAERIVGNGTMHAALFGDGFGEGALAYTSPVFSIDSGELRDTCENGCAVSCRDCGATILEHCYRCASRA